MGATVGNQPVAVNPKNAARFIAAYVANGACYTRSSADGGQTWAVAKKLPMPTGTQPCDGSGVDLGPDGSRVYAAYSYVRKDNTGRVKEVGAVGSFSRDQGVTWSSPVKALRYTDDLDGDGVVEGDFFSLRLATPLRVAAAEWVYLAANVFRGYYGEIVFTRSADRAQTWSPREALDAYDGNFVFDYPPASVAGGPGGEVLVAWGSVGDVGSPAVKVVRSGDYGGHFADEVVAVPNAAATATAAAFGVGGVAHIVYQQCNSTSDCDTSRIRYVYSSKAPYTSWSSPVTLNNDSGHQHYNPALGVSACGSDTSVLHVVWTYNRLGPDNYNVYYTRKVAQPGRPWSPNLRISGTSLADGFRLDPGIAAGADNAVALWGASEPRLGQSHRAGRRLSIARVCRRPGDNAGRLALAVDPPPRSRLSRRRPSASAPARRS